MKLLKMAAAAVLIFGAVQFLGSSQARAQTVLTGAQIQTLLVGNYACGSSGDDTWDEILSGTTTGTVTDYKQGPTDATDPTQAVGSYTISTGGSPDTITYNYGAGGTFAYSVVDPTGTNLPNPGTYTFVGQGAAPTLTITVASSPCQPHRT